MNNISSNIASTNQNNAFVQLPNTSGLVIDLEDTFWNMFEKELPKYKNRLDAISFWPPLHSVNINMTYGHVFNNLQNYLINIMYVVDPKSIFALTLLGIIESS
jgi:hypothetical protein